MNSISTLSGFMRPFTEAAMSNTVVWPSVRVNEDDNALPSLATSSGIDRGVLEIKICLDIAADTESGLSLEAADAFILNAGCSSAVLISILLR